MSHAESDTNDSPPLLELQKLITALAMPLGTAVSLALVASGAAALACRRLAVAIGGAAICWLWLWSIPVVSEWVRGGIERQTPALPVHAPPSADAIVVLGSGMSGAVAPWRPYATLLLGLECRLRISGFVWLGESVAICWRSDPFEAGAAKGSEGRHPS